MSNYIYMSEDNAKTPSQRICIFKIGFSKDPVRRGGQLKQAARRSIGQEVHMKVKNYIAPIDSEDRQDAEFIEQYIIGKVEALPEARRISKEFFRISKRARQYCYNHLDEWVNEGKQIRGLA